MAVEHHTLGNDLPEFKDEIHALKLNNAHFRKLFDEYHELTRQIENMENEVTPVKTVEEEDAKQRRVHLKDELYHMLQKAAAEAL
ncbi:YdcH family protein [Salinispirillum marinum]|uniref:YdcH family protein n=2 Tax=Saccharospirillaceae TaxID=255527 RepID=A0ABV8BFM0_9GAMM